MMAVLTYYLDILIKISKVFLAGGEVLMGSKKKRPSEKDAKLRIRNGRFWVQNL